MLILGRETLGRSGELLAGIGAAGMHGSLALAEVAQQQGTGALLLPMPHYFPYSQDDLHAFCEAVARQVDAPVLLYNLPKFTTGLSVSTALELIASVPNIIGIKDSSGSLDILAALTARGGGACRIVGDDSVLVEAIEQGVCDGVVSGVAGVLPELMELLWGRRDSRQTPEYGAAAARLAELVERLSPLPVPWGLKWIAEARGIARASFSQPLSGERHRQGAALVQWFRDWWPKEASAHPLGVARGTVEHR